jgi:hypothetical protein
MQRSGCYNRVRFGLNIRIISGIYPSLCYSQQMTTCPLVCIWWEDSRQPESKWRLLTDLPEPEPVLCASVGWLVHDGLRVKQIAPNMGDLGCDVPQTSGVIQIAASSVVRMDRLKEPRPPKP